MIRVKPLEWAEHKESGNWTAEIDRLDRITPPTAQTEGE